MKTENKKQRLTTTWIRRVDLVWPAILLVAMAASPLSRAAESTAARPLRVGINPEYPPLVFRQPTATNGVEIDFAKALGAELNRPVEFVVSGFDQLIPGLLEGQTDIIMSGMSITKARQLRIAFSEPYLHNEVRAIFRNKDAAKFKTADDILKGKVKIGVIAGTTADVFVVKNCPNAERVVIATRKDVPPLLIRGGRMDCFIDDTFSLAQMISENEAELTYLQQALSEDDLAWGIRQDDRALLEAANRALAKWKADGTLDKILDRWIPYLKTIKEKRAKQPNA